MATFVFRLAPDSQPSEILRIHDQLNDRFPQHRFVTRDLAASDTQFDIAVLDTADPDLKPSRRPDPDEIDLVRHAFFSMLDHWG